jgi:hypothetical protein
MTKWSASKPFCELTVGPTTRAWPGERPGDLVDTVSGEVVGSHVGAHGFTSGSGAVWGRPGRRSTANRATSCRSTPPRTGRSSARPTCSGSTSSRATTCAGAVRRRQVRCGWGPGTCPRCGGGGRTLHQIHVLRTADPDSGALGLFETGKGRDRFHPPLGGEFWSLFPRTTCCHVRKRPSQGPLVLSI